MEDGMEITIEQVHALADSYEKSGLGETSSGRFLRGCAASGRMPRGRGITWLQELIAKNVPASIPPLVTDVKDLISRSVRPDTIEILEAILRSAASGWELSDHKKSELERLRKQVNEAMPDLELDKRSQHLLRGLSRKKLSRYMSNYWSSRPVISNRLDSIFKRWNAESKISPDDWEFVRKSFKGAVNDFESNRHPVGSLRWVRAGVPVTIMGEPQLDDRGNVLIEVLTPHNTLDLDIGNIYIRAPK